MLQDTASVLWARLHDYKGDGFLAWACQIAYYKVLEHRRRMGRAALLLDDDVLEQLATTAEANDASSTCSAALWIAVCNAWCPPIACCWNVATRRQ